MTEANAQYPPLAGIRVIETAALLWVMELERAAGREPADRRGTRCYPGDLESPPRMIELKAVGGSVRGADLPIEETQLQQAQTNPNFCLYVVDNVAQGNPAAFRLKVFAGEQLIRLIGRVREKCYFELPVPVSEFDSAPGIEALR